MRPRPLFYPFSVAVLLAALRLTIEPLQAGAAPASSVPSSDRVTIERCRSFLKMNAVQIMFRTEGPRTADAVAFTISLGSLSQTLVAAGTFSPGITIDRFFAADDGLTHTFRPLKCVVESVRYADGDAS